MPLRTSGRDLKGFYYILEVDAERYAKKWVPRQPQSWFANLSDDRLDGASTSTLEGRPPPPRHSSAALVGPARARGEKNDGET